MANSEYIGLITCPHCGNENATVHKQRTGTKKGRLYYRCYETVNGSAMLCGTIQSIGPAGQKYISENMRPIGAVESEPVPVEPPALIADVEPIGEPVPVRKSEPVRVGRLSKFLSAIGDE